MLQTSKLSGELQPTHAARGRHAADMQHTCSCWCTDPSGKVMFISWNQSRKSGVHFFIINVFVSITYIKRRVLINTVSVKLLSPPVGRQSNYTLGPTVCCSSVGAQTEAKSLCSALENQSVLNGVASGELARAAENRRIHLVVITLISFVSAALTRA